MDSFEGVYARLNTAQRLAVDTIEGPVLVVAGPGTGKTQLLTTRIANILAKTDTLPENILCLTFTDSAAHTMRERLSSIIGSAAYNITISTYHAFGSELIRRYPEYFVASNDLRPVDDLTIDAIFRSILDHLPYSNPLKHDVFLRDIKTLISDAKRALLTPDDLRAIGRTNAHFIAAANKLIKQHLHDVSRVSKTAVPHFTALLEAGKSLPTEQPASQVLNLSLLWSEQLGAALDHFDQTSKTTELTKWKSTWLVKNEANEWITAGSDQVRKLEAAATIYERYLAQLSEHNLYDYDDMILHAIHGLEAHADLRFTLQERYLYILLDEYQDTNEAQSRLVELLTDNPVNEGRPNVMAVGDDDQAIYAFQGANYSHMFNFYQCYRDVLVVPLAENYRSHPDILHVAEGISDQIEARLHHHFPNVDKTLTAANKDLPEKAVVKRYEFKSDLSQNAWIAKQIKQLNGQGIAPKDIAVLAPKHEYLEALVPFLHHESIPIHYDKRENVLDDDTISQLILMSRLVIALSERRHDIANHLWPQVLSFRFWRLPTSLIWQLSWQASEDHSAWVDVLCERADTKPIALFFIRLSQLVDATTLEQMMDYLIGVTAVELDEAEIAKYKSLFYEFYFGTTTEELEQTEAFWQLLSNLTVLRQHLREYRGLENAPLRLRDFIEFVEANRAAGIKILNTSPYQESTDAVELMTAYKAKGQEFAVVFVVAAIDEVWGSKARNLGSRLSIPENLRFIRYAGTTEDERLRLLYVALTRAETHLYLTSFTNTYTGKLTNRLKYLKEYAEGTEIISPLLPAGEQTVVQEDHQPPELSELTIYWQSRHYRAVQQPKLKDLLAPRLEHYQLSPTQFNCFLDTRSNGPQTFFVQNILRFPSAPTVSAQYGNAIHETIEWIHLFRKENNRLPTSPQMLKVFERRLLAKRLGEPHDSLLLERGRETLHAYLRERAATITVPNFTEYNFRSEGVFMGKAHLSGKIDKLIVNKEDRTLVIVDYKTGKSYQRWSREARLHFYQNQLYLYKALVERSHTFHDYQVSDAYLEFVEADDDGRVQELHIDFSADRQREIEQLVEAVWQHVCDLNFPDVAAYSPDLKGIETFERDLREGAI